MKFSYDKLLKNRTNSITRGKEGETSMGKA